MSNMSKTIDFLALTTEKDQTLIENNQTGPYTIIFSLILVNVFVIMYLHVQIEIYKAKGTSPYVGKSSFVSLFEWTPS